jgi:hypothetical protein
MILGGILAALLMSILLLRLMFPAPNTAIASRSSIRARLAVPEILREFPVEEHVSPRDWFVYRRAAGPGGRRNWTLYIACTGNDPDKWRRAFRIYLGKHGEIVERGSVTMTEGQEQRFHLRRDSGDVAFVRMKNLSGNLHITFEYHKAIRRSRFWNTKLGIYLARILLKLGMPPDAITMPS